MTYKEGLGIGKRFRKKEDLAHRNKETGIRILAICYLVVGERGIASFYLKERASIQDFKIFG